MSKRRLSTHKATWAPWVSRFISQNRICISAFSNTDLDEVLRTREIEDVVICGVVASICIGSAGRGAFECGYRVSFYPIASSDAHNSMKNFMDICVPGMSGLDATRAIRRLGGPLAAVPIIAMTAHAVKGYQEECLAAGMNDYATKPISKQDLLALVQKWHCSAG